MAEFGGWQKRLYLVAESSWGQFPSSPNYLYLPHTEYGVRVRPQAIEAELCTGLRQRRHRRVTGASVGGTLKLPLFAYHQGGKSVAEHLLGWALSSPGSINLASYSAEYVEAGVADKRHHGLRVNRALIQGNSRTGRVEIELDLLGKTESAITSSTTVDPLAARPSEFLFRDCALSLNGTLLPMAGFTVRVDNHLQTYRTNSYWPSYLIAGPRTVDVQFLVYKTTSVLDALRRNAEEESSITLRLQGAHLGAGPSGTQFTRVDLGFSVSSLVDVAEEGNVRDIQRQQASFALLKPSSVSDELSATFMTV